MTTMARLPRSIASALTLVAVVALRAPTNAMMTPKSCALTAKAGFESCKLGAQSDAARAVGTCDNIPDPTQSKTCLQLAAMDRKDALQTCREENDLRQTVCRRLGPGPYAPAIEPANFTNSTIIDNDYFPLSPGTTFV